jgi:hypothetical protein
MKPSWIAILAVLFLPATVSASNDDRAANTSQVETAPQLPSLRDELLAMMAVDQTARNALIASDFKDEAAQLSMREIDRRNTARMKQIVASTGWPTRTQVGKEAARAAWLIVQHADADPKFQADCLERMEPLVATGEASGADFAYLTDRVLVNAGNEQRYGTQMEQVDGKYEPKPVHDPEGLEARRAAVGLPTMDAYRQMMADVYRQKPSGE